MCLLLILAGVKGTRFKKQAEKGWGVGSGLSMCVICCIIILMTHYQEVTCPDCGSNKIMKSGRSA